MITERKKDAHASSSFAFTPKGWLNVGGIKTTALVNGLRQISSLLCFQDVLALSFFVISAILHSKISSMEVVASIVGLFVETGRLFFGRIHSMINNAIKFRANLDGFEEGTRCLRILQHELLNQTEFAMTKGEVPLCQVVPWSWNRLRQSRTFCLKSIRFKL